MLNSIEINNFQGIKYLKIDKLNRITIIGGKNNTGKTSLLQAMHMLFDDVNANNDSLECLSPYRLSIPNQPFLNTFYKANIENTIIINANINNNINKSLHIDFNTNIQVNEDESNSDENFRTDTRQTFDLKFKTGNNKEQKFPLFIRNAYNNSRYTQHKFISDINFRRKTSTINIYFCSLGFMQRLPTNYLDIFSQIYINNYTNDVIEILKIIEPKIVNLNQALNTLYLELENNEKVPINFMGEGFKRLLEIIMCIILAKNSIVLIDEFENGLHWSVLQSIWEAISIACDKFNCQIICTTHSQELITYANEAMKKTNQQHNFGYIRLAKKDDEVKAYYLDGETINGALSDELEVR